MSEWKKYIEYIMEHAREEGAYLASSEYRPYKKVWLRDHAMTSYLLLKMQYNIKDEIDWLENLLAKEHEKVKKVMSIPRNTPSFYEEGNHPAARYTPRMQRINENWSERQYDGIALSVLLFLEYHIEGGGMLPSFLRDYLDYLFYVHGTPCASLWEMHDDHVHAYTVGLIAYTLQRASLVFPDYKKKYEYVMEFLKSRFLEGNELKAMFKVKRYGVCASSLLLLSRFDIFRQSSYLKDHVFNTISRELSPDGTGLYRYRVKEKGEEDTYFGGNVWYITTYWRANYLVSRRKFQAINSVLEYYDEFPLGEQIPDMKYVIDKNKYYEWIGKSKKENNGIEGPAKPLTWSMAERAYLEYRLEES